MNAPRGRRSPLARMDGIAIPRLVVPPRERQEIMLNTRISRSLNARLQAYLDTEDPQLRLTAADVVRTLLSKFLDNEFGRIW